MSLIVILVLVFLFFLVLKHRKNLSKNLPPGPSKLPILGNIHQLDFKMLQVSLWELSKKYGPLMSLQLGHVPAIVVSSPSIAKDILKTHDLIFASRPFMVGWEKLSYGALDLAFAPYNEYWRDMRKVCMVHLFNIKRASSFHHVRSEETSRMIDKISRDADLSTITNLSDAAISLTSDIICRIAFSKRYEEGQENKRFHKLVQEAQAMMSGFFLQDYFPYMGWFDMLSGISSRLQKAFLDLDEFYQEIIDDHLDPKRPKSEVEDFIDILLGIKRDNLFSSELTWKHIKGVLMNVFVAGTDTTAASLIWAMTMLIKNPRVLHKVQQEIRANVQNKKLVTEDDINNLPYYNAVIKETLRMYPPVPLLVHRESLQPCTVNGYDIPPKTLVIINAYAIGRDDGVWENPNEFYPERFLGKSIDFKGQSYEFIPFGSGRRICPGIHLGMASLEIALVNVLYLFDWKLPPGVKAEDIDMTTLSGIAMHKKVPLCLQAIKYKK